jgi:hypothetical protein
MKSMGAVLAAVLMLNGCAYNGLLGFELEITSDAVSVRPVTDEVTEFRAHCLPGDADKNWC